MCAPPPPDSPVDIPVAADPVEDVSAVDPDEEPEDDVNLFCMCE